MQDSLQIRDVEQLTAPALKLLPGDSVSIVAGNKTYRGTMMFDDGRWYVKIAGVEPGNLTRL